MDLSPWLKRIQTIQNSLSMHTGAPGGGQCTNARACSTRRICEVFAPLPPAVQRSVYVSQRMTTTYSHHPEPAKYAYWRSRRGSVYKRTSMLNSTLNGVVGKSNEAFMDLSPWLKRIQTIQNSLSMHTGAPGGGQCTNARACSTRRICEVFAPLPPAVQRSVYVSQRMTTTYSHHPEPAKSVYVSQRMTTTYSHHPEPAKYAYWRSRRGSVYKRTSMLNSTLNGVVGKSNEAFMDLSPWLKRIQTIQNSLSMHTGAPGGGQCTNARACSTRRICEVFAPLPPAVQRSVYVSQRMTTTYSHHPEPAKYAYWRSRRGSVYKRTSMLNSTLNGVVGKSNEAFMDLSPWLKRIQTIQNSLSMHTGAPGGVNGVVGKSNEAFMDLSPWLKRIQTIQNSLSMHTGAPGGGQCTNARACSTRRICEVFAPLPPAVQRSVYVSQRMTTTYSHHPEPAKSVYVSQRMTTTYSHHPEPAKYAYWRSRRGSVYKRTSMLNSTLNGVVGKSNEAFMDLSPWLKRIQTIQNSLSMHTGAPGGGQCTNARACSTRRICEVFAPLPPAVQRSVYVSQRMTTTYSHHPEPAKSVYVSQRMTTTYSHHPEPAKYAYWRSRRGSVYKRTSMLNSTLNGVVGKSNEAFMDLSPWLKRIQTIQNSLSMHTGAPGGGQCTNARACSTRRICEVFAPLPPAVQRSVYVSQRMTTTYSHHPEPAKSVYVSQRMTTTYSHHPEPAKYAYWRSRRGSVYKRTSMLNSTLNGVVGKSNEAFMDLSPWLKRIQTIQNSLSMHTGAPGGGQCTNARACSTRRICEVFAPLPPAVQRSVYVSQRMTTTYSHHPEPAKSVYVSQRMTTTYSHHPEPAKYAYWRSRRGSVYKRTSMLNSTLNGVVGKSNEAFMDLSPWLKRIQTIQNSLSMHTGAPGGGQCTNARACSTRRICEVFAPLPPAVQRSVYVSQRMTTTYSHHPEPAKYAYWRSRRGSVYKRTSMLNSTLNGVVGKSNEAFMDLSPWLKRIQTIQNSLSMHTGAPGGGQCTNARACSTRRICEVFAPLPPAVQRSVYVSQRMTTTYSHHPEPAKYAYWRSRRGSVYKRTSMLNSTLNGVVGKSNEAFMDLSPWLKRIQTIQNSLSMHTGAPGGGQCTNARACSTRRICEVFAPLPPAVQRSVYVSQRMTTTYSHHPEPANHAKRIHNPEPLSMHTGAPGGGQFNGVVGKSNEAFMDLSPWLKRIQTIQNSLSMHTGAPGGGQCTNARACSTRRICEVFAPLPPAVQRSVYVSQRMTTTYSHHPEPAKSVYVSQRMTTTYSHHPEPAKYAYWRSRRGSVYKRTSMLNSTLNGVVGKSNEAFMDLSPWLKRIQTIQNSLSMHTGAPGGGQCTNARACSTRRICEVFAPLPPAVQRSVYVSQRMTTTYSHHPEPAKSVYVSQRMTTTYSHHPEPAKYAYWRSRRGSVYKRTSMLNSTLNGVVGKSNEAFMDLSPWLKRIQTIQNSLSMHTGAPGGGQCTNARACSTRRICEVFAPLPPAVQRSVYVSQRMTTTYSHHPEPAKSVYVSQRMTTTYSHHPEPAKYAYWRSRRGSVYKRTSMLNSTLNGVVGKSNEAFMDLSPWLKRIQTIQNSLSMHTGAPGGGQCTNARACSTRRICEVFAPLPPAVQRSVYVSQRMTTTYSHHPEPAKSVYVSQRMTTTYSHHPEPAKYAYWRSRRGSVYKRTSMLNSTLNGVVGKSNEAFMDLSPWLKRIQTIQNSLSMHTGAPGGGQCTNARACSTRRICEVFAPLPPAVQRSVYVSQRMTTTYSHHPEPAKYAYWRSRRGSVYKRTSMLNSTLNGVVGKSNEAFMDLSPWLKRIQTIQNSLSMHTGAPGGGQCTNARACSTRRICEVFAPLPPAVQRSVYVSQRMTTTYSHHPEPAKSVYVSQRMTTTYSHHPEPAKYAYWRSRRGSVYKRTSMLNSTLNGVVGKSNEAFMDLSPWLKRIQTIQNSLSMHTGAPGGGQCTNARACSTRRICEVFAPLPPAVQRSVYVSQRMTTTYSHHPEPANVCPSSATVNGVVGKSNEAFMDLSPWLKRIQTIQNSLSMHTGAPGGGQCTNARACSTRRICEVFAPLPPAVQRSVYVSQRMTTTYSHHPEPAKSVYVSQRMTTTYSHHPEPAKYAYWRSRRGSVYKRTSMLNSTLNGVVGKSNEAFMDLSPWLKRIQTIQNSLSMHTGAPGGGQCTNARACSTRRICEVFAPLPPAVQRSVYVSQRMTTTYSHHPEPAKSVYVSQRMTTTYSHHPEPAKYAYWRSRRGSVYKRTSMLNSTLNGVVGKSNEAFMDLSPWLKRIQTIQNSLSMHTGAPGGGQCTNARACSTRRICEVFAPLPPAVQRSVYVSQRMTTTYSHHPEPAKSVYVSQRMTTTYSHHPEPAKYAYWRSRRGSVYKRTSMLNSTLNGVVGKSNEAFMDLSPWLKRIQTIQNSLSMHTGAPGGGQCTNARACSTRRICEVFAPLPPAVQRSVYVSQRMTTTYSHHPEPAKYAYWRSRRGSNPLSMHTGAPGGGQCTNARACSTRRICEVFAPLPPAVQRSVYVSQRMTTTYSHHPEPAKYAYWRSRRGSVYKRTSMLNSTLNGVVGESNEAFMDLSPWLKRIQTIQNSLSMHTGAPGGGQFNGVVGKSNEAFMDLSPWLKRIQTIQNSLSMHTGAPGGGQCTNARACSTRRICEVFAPLPPAVQRSVYVSQRMTTTYSHHPEPAKSVYVSQRMTTTYSHHPEPAKYAYWRSRRGSVYKRTSMLNSTLNGVVGKSNEAFMDLSPWLKRIQTIQNSLSMHTGAPGGGQCTNARACSTRRICEVFAPLPPAVQRSVYVSQRMTTTYSHHPEPAKYAYWRSRRGSVYKRTSMLNSTLNGVVGKSNEAFMDLSPWLKRIQTIQNSLSMHTGAPGGGQCTNARACSTRRICEVFAPLPPAVQRSVYVSQRMTTTYSHHPEPANGPKKRVCVSAYDYNVFTPPRTR
ncbi:hypothetical protein BCR41DRAFT_402278 [Lobosporangium transversale]|uniref:Uncharacterized protein n=1 Tax=Lobosporangium transversale TaxID=64571 RepID=A0A1Y2G5M2_9FUNG|nr:hypothetical protein BCR41DRAFT_402278 [Lobosporangium transversale]ORY95192.1 hypothetical protein BCR41DRAFT_402278 [Lobosporangium transversale]|eukprot:XP_021875392.1 hypothetical protein BCR41DRAFT_402278 [Lobosporangium transversale]